MDKIEQARLEQLERKIPNVWRNKKVLYIGGGEYRHHFFDALKANNCIITVVEIDQDSCLWLMQTQQWISCVLNLDIVDYMTMGPGEDLYDMIIWSHGISCLTKEEGHNILRCHLENFVRPDGLIVNMTPHGEAGGTGNISSWFPDEFNKLGYNTDYLGERGERNSHVLAWKYKEIDDDDLA